LPIVAPFDDRVCARLYDQVGAASRAHGMPFFRVVDAFAGENPNLYRKPGDRFDATHPAAGGHRRIAEYLTKELAPILAHAASAADGHALVAPRDAAAAR
jgi:lysophospholipase L1-like esterase